MSEPESQKEATGNSGAKEPFWDKNYQERRYLQEDGTTVPLYDQILTEAICNTQRFDPNEEDHKRSLHRNRFSKLLGE